MSSGFRILFLRILHVPLLYKVLLFNCGTTALLAVAGALVAIPHVQALPADAHTDLIGFFLAASIGVSLVVEFLLLRLVLAPLDQLDAAVAAAGHGKHQPLPPSVIGDERLDRLAATFTGMQRTLHDNAQQLQRLAQRVVSAQEDERARIARELHDEIAQTLTAVLLYMKLVEKSAEPDQTQRLQNLRRLITHALHDMRQLAVDLHPPILDDWGLEAALGQRVSELNADGARQITLQVVGGSNERLPRVLEVTFFHVAQEALNNVVHHSRSHGTHVVLRREVAWLTLAVEDDGVGFDPNVLRARRAGGFGLASMRERLALVNGELTIDSQPGRGTRIFARAPMSTAPSPRETLLPGAASRSE